MMHAERKKKNIVGDLTHEFQFERRVSYLLGHGILVVASILIALNFTKHLLDNITTINKSVDTTLLPLSYTCW